MKGGYLGQLLRVNLNEGKVRSENLLDVFPEDVLKKYVGCFGLGLRFLYDNLSAKEQRRHP